MRLKTDKKILLLGGSYAQIPAIRAAKKKGLYTILCDYLPDNPGQKFADEYINVSTTDKEEILEIAKKHKADYVLAYASDPAAPTAAYVSEKLGLPGNSYQSVKTLSEKHQFRQLLTDLDLPCPRTLSFTKKEISSVKELHLHYPLIVKPVDSSGSKGVSLIPFFSEFHKAAEYALTFSRSSQIIVEEFIDNNNGDLHGDGFVAEGKLIAMYVGDHIYNKNVNPFNPCGTIWPSKQSEIILNEVEQQIQTIIDGSGYKNGPINIEARVNSENNIHIMEIGPRSGGHFVPQAIEYSTEFDMVRASVDVVLGEKVAEPEKDRMKPVAYYAIHSEQNGKLKTLTISPEILSYTKEYHQYVQIGDEIGSFQSSNTALGILLMSFPSKTVMLDIMSDIKEYVVVEVE